MSSYSYPEMPLRGRVWHEVYAIPPTDPADRGDVPLSLSPVKPELYASARLTPSLYHPFTHIIRTALDPLVVDNYLRGDEVSLWPASTYEIPSGSGHFYLVLWSHEVGAGFANHHQRIYVCRYNLGMLADLPWFQGWI